MQPDDTNRNPPSEVTPRPPGAAEGTRGELPQSEERFQAIWEHAADAMVLSDAGGTVLLANPAYYELYGYSPDEVLGNDFGIIFPAEQREWARAQYQEIFQQDGDPPIVESWIERADGTRRFVETRVTFLTERGLTERGQRTAMLSIVRDVTARKRAEDSQRFLARASGVLVSSLDETATLQALAHLVVPELADYCLIYRTRDEGGVEIVGLAHADRDEELALWELERRYGPDPADPHSTIAQALRTGEPQLLTEFSDAHLAALARTDEHHRLLRRFRAHAGMVIPLRARGQTLGVITCMATRPGRRYEAEDLELAEELARRSAFAIDNVELYREAQRAVRTRDEFLSVAAHELKTPITSLRGFAQLALRQLDQGGIADVARLHRALDVIDRQSDKLARLVVQLLDVSRIEAGRLALDRHRMELRTLVQTVVEAAQARSGLHTVIMDGPAPVHAMVDPLRLEQVLTNLLDNAIKYSPEGAPIRIEVLATAHGTARIAVSDQGIGIPSEHRDRIFDRFYQAHVGGYTAGLGLGLYVSRQIVELHGGKLTAEFPAEGGSCFLVDLPLEPASEGRQQTGEAEPGG